MNANRLLQSPMRGRRIGSNQGSRRAASGPADLFTFKSDLHSHTRIHRCSASTGDSLASIRVPKWCAGSWRLATGGVRMGMSREPRMRESDRSTDDPNSAESVVWPARPYLSTHTEPISIRLKRFPRRFSCVVLVRQAARILHQGGETGAHTWFEGRDSMHVRANTWCRGGTHLSRPWRGLERLHLRFTCVIHRHPFDKIGSKQT